MIKKIIQIVKIVFVKTGFVKTGFKPVSTNTVHNQIFESLMNDAQKKNTHCQMQLMINRKVEEAYVHGLRDGRKGRLMIILN